MKTIANILWFIITGLITAISWFILGFLWCITIIGIPFGKQCFKYARLSLWPFGRKIIADFNKHAILNALWIVLGGFGLFIEYVLCGIFWCITIIGIPFGKQSFKFAKLSLMPFGAKIEKA